VPPAAQRCDTPPREPRRGQTLAVQPGRRRLPCSHFRVRVEPAMPRHCL
jgi:hypothetical protein